MFNLDTITQVQIRGGGFWARFFCLVLHGEQSVSSAELRQASVKSPTKGELSSAYALLTVENQTKKPGPGVWTPSFGSRCRLFACRPKLSLPFKNPASAPVKYPKIKIYCMEVKLSTISFSLGNLMIYYRGFLPQFLFWLM